MKAIFIKMILFYQKRLSPLISSTGIKCNPFSKGGYDPLK